MLRAILLSFLILFSSAGWCASDMLLDRLLQEHRTRGDAGVRRFARGLGMVLRKRDGVLLVPVIAARSLERAAQFSQRLSKAGAQVDAVSRSWLRILVPAAHLEQLLGEFPQDRLRAPSPVIPASGTGTVVSESVALTAADGFQAGNLTGAGVRVAVVDLGFSGLSAKISAGELPQGTVTMDFTGTGIESTTSHGTGVAEHVMDMAPDAQLYCLKVNGDPVSMQNAASYLAANNIRIANHSVSWFLDSYYDDTGQINDIINSSHDNDHVFWTVAAGNMQRRHWRGGWADANGNDILDFAPGDELLGLAGSAATATVFLNWNQYGQSRKTNLDLFVYDKNGVTAASSTVFQTSMNDPAEAVSFNYDSSRAPYSIQVVRVSGSTSNLDITLFSVYHNFDGYVAASSVTDPADAHGAFAVGAINQANWLNATPAIDSYSSQGPSNAGLAKPELVAPDHTSSLTYGTLSSSGTSFAAPTVAGAAALLLSEDGSRTAPQLAGVLESTAVDIGTAGFDTVYGYGKLQLPLIDSDNDGLTNEEELQLGTDPLAADTDQDGLSDYDEVQTWHTDPLLADTDADGISDYAEVMTWGTDPQVSNLADLAPRGSPDGEINAGDLVVLARLVTGEDIPTGAEQVFGDLDGNGMLNAADLLLLTRMLTGQIPLP